MKIALDVMEKAGYLSQANLAENPYVWIQALGLIEGKPPREEVLMFAMRNLIQCLQEDPKAWAKAQNEIALKSSERCIATLERLLTTKLTLNQTVCVKLLVFVNLILFNLQLKLIEHLELKCEFLVIWSLMKELLL